MPGIDILQQHRNSLPLHINEEVLLYQREAWCMKFMEEQAFTATAAASIPHSRDDCLDPVAVALEGCPDGCPVDLHIILLLLWMRKLRLGESRKKCLCD